MAQRDHVLPDNEVIFLAGRMQSGDVEQNLQSPRRQPNSVIVRFQVCV